MSSSSVGKNTLLMREVRGEWTDSFKLTVKVTDCSYSGFSCSTLCLMSLRIGLCLY
uniref:Uncharacterized protein n=1 Tax=Anguilla anguilla TaxID=7936 RepID=A0A0E9PU03_ANGAN